MKHLLQRLIPINIFQITGTMCCLPMRNNYTKNDLAHHRFCYNAASIYEANTLILWGDISPKLQERISTYTSFLPYKHAVIHITGCAQENPINLPNILVVRDCMLEKSQRQKTYVEVRECLAA